MRAGIGLLSILIAAAIIFYVSFGGDKGGETGATLREGKKAQEQANQLSGRDANGVPAGESIKLDAVNVDGHLKRLKVVSVVAGGPFDAAYGLKAGDEISEIGGLDVGMNDDAGLAEAQVVEAYGRNQPLTIRRVEQKITLTPKSPLSDFHPENFGKPGAVAIPSH